MLDKKILEEIQNAIASGDFAKAPDDYTKDLSKIFVQPSTIAEILTEALEPAEPPLKEVKLDGLVIDAIKGVIQNWIQKHGHVIIRAELETQLPKIVHLLLNKLLPGIIKNTLLELKDSDIFKK